MQFHGSDRGRSRLSSAWRAFLAVIVAVAFAGHGMAQAPAPDAGGAPAPLSAEDLDALVGRIALYPDDLVAIILPGSTFPCRSSRRTGSSTSARAIPSCRSTRSGTTR